MYPPSTNKFIEIDLRRLDYCPNGTGMSKPSKEREPIVSAAGAVLTFRIALNGFILIFTFIAARQIITELSAGAVKG
jgi:hypothetical protein